MKIKIWRLNCSLILFIIYNFIYSVYMAGFMTRTAYLASLAIFLGYSFAHIIYVRSGRIVLGQLKFWDETRLILLTILCFLSITLIRQAFYVNFVPFFVERLLYLALPIVIVFCIMNSNVEDKTIFVYIMLFRMILQFLLVNFNQLTLDNIMSISWFDSSSSLFESSQAHELFIITVLLLCIKRKLLAVIATVLCMLNFKRVSFLFCIVAWIVVPRLKEKVYHIG